jgi:hypothetical protein
MGPLPILKIKADVMKLAQKRNSGHKFFFEALSGHVISVLKTFFWTLKGILRFIFYQLLLFLKRFRYKNVELSFSAFTFFIKIKLW